MSEARKKVIVTGRMDADLLDRAKAMAYWTPGLTLSRLLEDALRGHLETLERETGTKAPAPHALKMGRPLKVEGGR